MPEISLFKKILSFLASPRFFLLVFLFLTANCSSAAEVAIIKSKDIQPYNLAIKGFSGVVRAAVAEDDMNADLDKGMSILKKVKSQKPDAIFSVGAEATFAAANSIKEIPVVFFMLFDPERYKLEGENVTGVKLEIPLEEQIRKLREVMPEVKRIGTIYGEEKTKLLFDEIKPVLAGLGIELMAERISSPKDIPAAMDRLVPKMDAFWLVFDSVAVSSPRVVQEIILFQSLKNRIPVIGFNKWSVTAGALFCLYTDFEDVGIQAGKIVNRILKGEFPSSIPVESPENVKVFFNEKVMQRVGTKLKLEVPNNSYIWEGE